MSSSSLSALSFLRLLGIVWSTRRIVDVPAFKESFNYAREYAKVQSSYMFTSQRSNTVDFTMDAVILLHILDCH